MSGEHGQWCADRADALEDCGVWGTARGCVHCGRPLDGGFSPSPGTSGYCRTRSCPWCARRRSARSAGLGARILAEPWAEGADWYLVTVTAPRDPYDPNDGTVEALRSRLAALHAGFSRLVKILKKEGGLIGAARGTELSSGPNGHIHAHALVAWRPSARGLRSFVERREDGAKSWVRDPGASEWWDEALVSAGLGEIYDSRPVSDIEKSIAEVLKYAVKAPEPSKWNEPREVVSPVLAARWELASKGARLREKYGAFRKLTWEDERGDAEPYTIEDELACQCQNCHRYDFEPVRGRTTDLLSWYREWKVDPLRGPARAVRVDPFLSRDLSDFRRLVRSRFGGCRGG